MKSDSQDNRKDLKVRTKQFAIRCMKLCEALPNNWAGNHLRVQLFKSTTSIAANYRSACAALSRKSFISKLGIVVEEADEASFWIEFIVDSNLLSSNHCAEILKESKELMAIFVKSQKTARSNDNLKIEL